MRCSALLLGLTLATVGTDAPAQSLTWEPVPLATADVQALSVLPDGEVYVASRGGLQRTFDGGGSWSTWLTTRDVADLAYAPGEVLFVGTNRLCHEDRGARFACGGVTAWHDLGGSLALGAMIGNEADAGSRLAGLVATPDGRGWAAIGNDVWSYSRSRWEREELPVDAILGLHLGPGGRLYAPTTGGLFARDAQSDTWSRLGLEGTALTSAFETTGGAVFAGSSGGRVYRLGEGDGSGVAVASSAILSLYASPLTRMRPSVLFAGTAGEGLFRSLDGGDTWTATLEDAVIPDLGGLGTTVWAVVGRDGLRRSDDGGATWEAFRWDDIRAKHVEAGPGGLVIAGDAGPYGLFAYARSTDTWRPIGLGRDAQHPTRTISDVVAAPDGRLYAAVLDLYDDAQRSVLYRSVDGGTTWQVAHVFPLRGPLGNEGFVRILAAGPDGALVAGTGPAAEEGAEIRSLLYRSDDGGTTWRETASLDAYQVSALTFGSEGEVYAGVGIESPEMYRSDDRGQTWTALGAVDVGGSIQSVLGLAATKSGALVAALNAEGTYRSTDRGQTWERVLDRGHWAVTAYGDDGVLVASTGVRRSDDGGRSWEEAGIDRSYASDVAVAASGTAYAAFKQDGLFRTLDAVVAAESGAASFGSALSAYPNPFAHSTTLLLSLDAPRRITVGVYDVLGRRVSVLHRGPLSAGEHPLTFDRGALPSGVYIVRAEGEDVALSQRVLILR